jgi:hypothetical protein
MGQVMDADRSILDTNERPGFIKEKKPETENPYARNYYLTPQWQIGEVDFVNDVTLENVLLKYDVVKHIVEIKDGEEVFMVSARSVDHFRWFNNSDSDFEEFESTRNFYNVPEALFGFFEVLIDTQVGMVDYKVLTHHNVYVYVANTSVSLSGSHKTNDLFWESKFFLFENGTIVPIPEKRKDTYALFGEHQEEMKRFIKRKGLYFKDKNDVELIFAEYFKLIS